MRSTVLAALLIAASSTALAAQAPRAGMQQRAPGAQLLLARTGELQLTDAQVVRLAAIARRSQARRQSMRASIDSARNRFSPGTTPDSAARRQLGQRLRADAERMRDQEHADRRDAIAVLTADQQARAWEMVSRVGRERGMRRQMMGQRMRQNRPGERKRGFGPDRAGPAGRGERRPMRPMRPMPPTDQ